MGVKYSQYNTLLKVNDKFGLFYNAMSDKFIMDQIILLCF